MKVIEYEKILGMRSDEARALADSIKNVKKAHTHSN